MTTKKPDPLSESQPVRIASIEQRLEIDVVRKETGAVRIRKVVHKDAMEIPIVLRRRVVTLDRVQVNQFVDVEYAPRREGETLIVPVFEYVPVTELRLMLKEEIRIGFGETEEAGVHRAEVQRQELVVERQTGTGDWVADNAMPSSNEGEQSAT